MFCCSNYRPEIAFHVFGFQKPHLNLSKHGLDHYIENILTNLKIYSFVSNTLEIMSIHLQGAKWWQYIKRNPSSKSEAKGWGSSMLLARMLFILLQPVYQFQYVKGKENTAADYLSRLPSDVDQSVNNDVDHFERHLFLYLISMNYFRE